MKIPTVHMNGTQQQELVDQQLDAMDGLRAGLHKLKQAGPNARDYYPQGPDAFPQANEEHLARVKAVEGVIADLEALALAITDGGYR